MTIVQGSNDDQLAAILMYADALPTSPSTTVPAIALSGFVGNFHLSLSDANPAVTLSGTVNRKGTSIELNGVLATDSMTYEILVKLKRDHN
jgi:hypothetical protein